MDLFLIGLADRIQANDLTIKGFDQIIDAGPKSILFEIVRIPEKTHEVMLQLGAAIAQRVTRIDLFFPGAQRDLVKS